MSFRALVVDDSATMRNMVKRIVGRTNLGEFQFTEAEDGQAALAKFDPLTTDIAFIDWNMPNMTGLEFAKRIRALGGRRVLIVMVTTEGTAVRRQEASEQAGVDAYVIKPFTVEDMARALRPILGRQAA